MTMSLNGASAKPRRKGRRGFFCRGFFLGFYFGRGAILSRRQF
ncbi:hypothetical protein [Methylocystis iwaonis]|nr:hypothetical protein [Methylocystis iwaonis]